MQAWGDSVQKMYSVALDLFGIDPKLVVVSSRRKQGVTRGSFPAHSRACPVNADANMCLLMAHGADIGPMVWSVPV